MHERVSLQAPGLKAQKLSITRQLSASWQALKALPPEQRIRVHHLGAGYPHPDVSEPSLYLAKKERYFRQLCERNGANDAEAVRARFDFDTHNYTDTLGPRETRVAFAAVYGRDFGTVMSPDKLIPTFGGTGSMNLVCSMFERAGVKIAYIADAPTYSGFLSRALLNSQATVFSVDMDEEGPKPEMLRSQIRAARAAGYFVPLYYTIPDGHNPAGVSIDQKRREEILRIAQEEGILILEDAAYIYISYRKPEERPKPFFVMDPKQTIHIFTGSKIGLPGPRIGFLYSEATLAVEDGKNIPVTELLVAEAAADMLFHNPDSLRAFEAYLSDDDGTFEKSSLWAMAERKLSVYADNRAILLSGLQEYLGAWPDKFSWTVPDGGFFSVFRFLDGKIETNATFIERMLNTYGLIVIPMFGFYPEDARTRDPRAGLDSLRISFCFNEGAGEGRRQDMREAIRTFCHAVRLESGLPGIL